MTARASNELWKVRSEPELDCMILPAESVIELWSKTIVEATGRTSGPVPVWPAPGERPASWMFVYR